MYFYEIQATTKTLPILQRLTRITKGKTLQNKIEDLRQKEQILTDMTEPWKDEAFHLSHVVESKLIELQ